MEQHIQPGFLSGTIQIPASKSDSQRAILCAALAEGKSRLSGLGSSEDEKAMLGSVRALGARVNLISPSLAEISGITEISEPLSLSAGESGLGLRLLTCVSAGFDQKVVLNGTGSLLKRPMDFFDEVLPEFGCEVKTTNGFLPIEVCGPLQGRDLTVDGSLSSQFISGLLMALPRSEQASSLTVSDMKSGPYIQMTLKTLRAFGIEIENQENVFRIPGNQSYRATDYRIEGDWSSASYWLAASAVGHAISISGLTMGSLQADKAMLNALMNAGCKIQIENQSVRIDGENLHPFEFDAENCPDLFPALVVLAAKCRGISTIKGVRRLEHKESNRGVTLQSEFGKMGLKIDLNDDEMVIHGTGSLEGAHVSSHHDHRIAMSLAIAGSFANGKTIIQNAEAVAKSYPDFWEHLHSLNE
ncbi:3-phosphoshikimate 1-carboxyvinyltransferase [Fluviicola sp.]|uniref:3-phosphoshikimate 1-carboxyvinyltransferase n=1 Tax=Fluviicola sp. TaxID=1917219 RepID=UPI00261E3334|nr:3-phosphoshikimate 1-carboxyvinyltransferase [Fluviicola sp.]